MTNMNTMVEAVDIRYVLLEQYKALGFNEKQVAVVLMLDHLIKQKNQLITAEHLSLKMSLPTEEIDQILVHLLSKKLIEYRTEQGVTFTTLEPLKQLLLQNFQQQIIRQTQDIQVPDIGNIYQWIEKQFMRTLSPIEVSSIRDWLNFGYSEVMIQEAVKQAITKHQYSIRIIDKILQKQTTKTNLHQEGIPGKNTDVRKQIDLINQQMQDEDNRNK